jgi:hypothetical protein
MSVDAVALAYEKMQLVYISEVAARAFRKIIVICDVFTHNFLLLTKRLQVMMHEFEPAAPFQL